MQRPLGVLFLEISPFCVSGWLAMCDSRGSSYPPKSPQPVYFWMWMTAVFSVLGQVLTHSAFLVLFPPNGCPGALPQVKVRSRHCHHPLLTGACLAASLEPSLSWSPDRPPTHSPPSCWAPVVSGPCCPDHCGYHSSLKT